ncbi:MAG: ATP-binding protein [Chloroflexota bacterium]
MDPFRDGHENLFAELQWLDALLQRQIARMRAANVLVENAFAGLYVPDAQVDALLAHAGGPQNGGNGRHAAPEPDLSPIELRRWLDRRERASLRAGVDLPLVRVAERFGLDGFERSVLLLALAVEIDSRYESLFAYVQNDVTKKRPTVDLALRLLCATVDESLRRRQVFSPAAPLLAGGLLSLYDDPQDRQPPLLARLLKADECITTYLLGAPCLDSRLLPFCQQRTPESSSETETEITVVVRQSLERGCVLVLHGPQDAGKLAGAEAACGAVQRPLLVVDLEAALEASLDVDALVVLLRKEALLSDAAIYLDRFEALLDGPRDSSRRALALVRRLARPGQLLFVGSRSSWQPGGWLEETPLLTFTCSLPDFPVRLQAWQAALEAEAGPGHGLDPTEIASKFVLGPAAIWAAAREASSRARTCSPGTGALSLADLYTAVRAQSASGLSRLAQKVELVYGWDDIVLPPRPLRQLQEVCASVAYRHVVYSQWGFERKLASSKGLNVLFSGPSGTGKTMAAQVLARELGLDLYKIDLSSVVSKYIGETEKNLNRIFQEAQASNAMLFFDEADALFGKRSEVKDAHDRYANVEVAYLLQKMEEYEGIAILATNLGQNMDEAFTRRMHHAVDFPFPEPAYRQRIWRSLFPPEAPLGPDVDFPFLARQFELSGGNIRNVALAAAFLAAQENTSIGMPHLVRAAAREYVKMGRLPTRADFGPYLDLTREKE